MNRDDFNHIAWASYQAFLNALWNRESFTPYNAVTARFLQRN